LLVVLLAAVLLAAVLLAAVLLLATVLGRRLNLDRFYTDYWY